MAAEERGGHAARASTGAWPGGAQPAGPPSGPRGCGARRGQPTPAAAEKRGPYRMVRVPSVPAQLQRHRDVAKAALRRKGLLGASPKRPDSSGKRSVKFNKGYTALSQSPDENLVSLNSDRVIVPDRNKGCKVLACAFDRSEVRGHDCIPQVNQDVSRQLLQDGYHLDEIPDDEDLDLIPPKPMASTCSCCWRCAGDAFSCSLQ
ncbi:protein FAM219B isoform X2 [Eptesicus fuscus]|uniref:protein FAM219B isoform X2 n=1 Tax=Eptesicus fuscus TaxID=29078 RepID=UPI002404108E|nr:protein FAM219B isoform X2 [Eptesicus fuscus]